MTDRQKKMLFYIEQLRNATKFNDASEALVALWADEFAPDLKEDLLSRSVRN